MKQSVLYIAGVLFFLSSILINRATAQDNTINGNGDGSTSSITSQNNSNTTNNQTNSAQIINDINAKAGSGGNSASENDGSAKITTGDARVSVGINNSVNQNSAQTSPCCETPTRAPTSGPTKTPGGSSQSPTPTQLPQTSTPVPTNAPQNGGIGGGSSDNGSPSNPSSASAPAILGLSDTSSINWDFVTRIVGTLCVATGSILLTKKHVSVA